ncbi:MAG: Zn-dependent oligopeptidase [Acidobacteria bacterium]|nr:Zn-dependent oligopeptidase [Acidobacteriota bacterium]
MTIVNESIDTRPRVPIPDATALARLCESSLSDGRARVAKIESAEPSEILDLWDDLEVELEDAFGPASLFSEVHPSPEVRRVAEDALIRYASFINDIFQNQKLFELVDRSDPSTDVSRKLRRDLLEEFEDNGAHLPADRRERIREIVARSSELEQEFARNIREESPKLSFSREEVAGLPPVIIDRLEQDGDKVLVGLDYPDYHPFMMNVGNADARRRLYMAFHQRGGQRNLEILDELTSLRAELADIYSLPSFADHVIRRRMARTPEAVRRFLEEVFAQVRQREKADLDEIRLEMARQERASPAEVELHRWDLPYFTERLRKRVYDVDQEETRQYFPTLESVNWVIETARRLYGVRFERVDAPLWEADVIAYDLHDERDHGFIGTIYLDLFPREGKFKHAAAWPLRGSARRIGRTPISVLVANFERRGLTHSEVETLFHEMGHVLHGVLSETWFVHHAGTSVERDFVEAPSQMFEWWARRPAGFAVLSEVAPHAPRVSQELIERLDGARSLGRGVHYARQHLYATFDMRLSGPAPAPSGDVWSEMEGQTPLGYVDQTRFPASFGHLAGGYAAGYYGYLWSEAIAYDLLSAFGDDLMDAETGRRFRNEILARGAERPGMDSVEAFLGRPISNDPFIRHIRGEEAIHAQTR